MAACKIELILLFLRAILWLAQNYNVCNYFAYGKRYESSSCILPRAVGFFGWRCCSILFGGNYSEQGVRTNQCQNPAEHGSELV